MRERFDSTLVANGLHDGLAMRISWALVLLGASGFVGCASRPCGGCADYASCDVVTDQCVINDGARFDLEAADGKVPGDDWDPLWGAPDPYVCVQAQGKAEQCTDDDSDSHSPKWNTVLLTDLDGALLQTEGLLIRYLDSDVDSPDPICAGPVMLQAKWINSGAFRYNCSNGASARFVLHNTVRGTPITQPLP
jgi:hypothetical protein